MKITEVRVFPTTEKDDKLRAFVNVTFDDCLVVRGLKVIEGSKGLFVVMPSRKVKGNEYRDVAHPVTADFKVYLEQEVLKSYKAFIEHEPMGDDEPAIHSFI